MQTPSSRPLWTPGPLCMDVELDDPERVKRNVFKSSEQVEDRITARGASFFQYLRILRDGAPDHNPPFGNFVKAIDASPTSDEFSHCDDVEMGKQLSREKYAKVLFHRMEEIISTISCLSWKEESILRLKKEAEFQQRITTIIRYMRFVRFHLEQNPIVAQVLQVIRDPSQDALPQDRRIARTAMYDDEAMTLLVALEQMFNVVPGRLCNREFPILLKALQHLSN